MITSSHTKSLPHPVAHNASSYNTHSASCSSEAVSKKSFIVKFVFAQAIQKTAIVWFSIAHQFKEAMEKKLITNKEMEKSKIYQKILCALDMLGPLQHAIDNNEKCLISYLNCRPQGIATVLDNFDNIEIIALCTNPLSIVRKTRGAGSSIVNYVKELAVKLGKHSIAVNSLKDAEVFYKKLGFIGEYNDLSLPITPSIKKFYLDLPERCYPINKVFIVPEQLYGRVCEDLDEYGQKNLANLIADENHSCSIILGIKDEHEDFKGIGVLDVNDPKSLVVNNLACTNTDTYNMLIRYVIKYANLSNRKAVLRSRPVLMKKKQPNPKKRLKADSSKLNTIPPKRQTIKKKKTTYPL